MRNTYAIVEITGCESTHQSNQTCPVINTKRVQHKLANVEFRTANNNCKDACANDGTIRDSNLVLLIRQQCHVYRCGGRHFGVLMEPEAHLENRPQQRMIPVSWDGIVSLYMMVIATAKPHSTESLCRNRNAHTATTRYPVAVRRREEKILCSLHGFNP